MADTATINDLADEPVTAGEIAQRLGVSADRIRVVPSPGTATVDDWVVAVERKVNSICELVDGTLVEKAMGAWEADIATNLSTLLAMAADKQRLCRSLDFPLFKVLGADGMALVGRNGRVPDVALYRFEDVPNDRSRATARPPVLAIEVLSPSNSKRELALKRADYFQAGVATVWEADLDDRCVSVWSSETSMTLYRDNDSIAVDELPQLAVPVSAWLDGDLISHVASLLEAVD